VEDEDILRLLWQRDETGLREAGAKYGPLCRGLAERVLGSPEDGEECWSDALLTLWNTVPPERPRHLRAYLLKLTRSRAIDRLRAARAAKRGGGEGPLLLEELEECLPGSPGAEGEVLARELGEAVSRFLRRESPTDRSLFLRRYFYGESNAALARDLGIKENTVAVRLRRIRARLRAALEREGFL
jgi:RNA polymerase sigma-70 factor (ECF subfamily)